MKNLQGDEIDDATHTVPTNGVNIYTVKNDTGEFDMVIKEIGGNMAPIWKHYFNKVLCKPKMRILINSHDIIKNMYCISCFHSY